MFRQSLSFLSAAIVVLAMTGCGGGGSSGSANTAVNPAAPTPADRLADLVSRPLGDLELLCPALGLSVSSGMPGAQVIMSGLPQEMGAPGIRVLAEDEQGSVQAIPLLVSAASPVGQAHFVVPFHPSLDPLGGDVMLEIGDGTVFCPALAFHIDELPEAPAGYIESLAVKIEQWVDGNIAAAGFDPDNYLSADTSDQAVELLLWLAKFFSSESGAGESSLVSLSKNMMTENRDLLARLFYSQNFDMEIDQALQTLNSAPVPLTSISKSSTAAMVRSGGLCREFDTGERDIETVEELSAAMTGFPPNILFDEPGVGQVLGGLALAGEDLAGEAGKWLFVGTAVNGLLKAKRPQTIDYFKVLEVGDLWIEDRPPSDPLIWRNATILASGSEINIDQMALDTLVNATGELPGPFGKLASLTTFVYSSEITQKIAEVTEDACYTIKAPQYGPFVVDDPRWTQASIIGDSFEMVGHSEYIAVDLGGAELEVSLLGEPFGLKESLPERYPLTTEQLVVSLIPDIGRVQSPGESIQLGVTANNAYTDQASFTAAIESGDGGEVLDQWKDGSQYFAFYRSPANPETFPGKVTFTSNFAYLLPQGKPQYQKTAMVELGQELVISPREGCLVPGETLDFEALLQGFSPAETRVNWTSSANGIVSTGDLTATFTAPPMSGSVDITATAVADASLSDSVTLTVSQACMRKVWWPSLNMQLDGNGTYVFESHAACPQESIAADMLLEEAVLPPEPLLDQQAFWYDESVTYQDDFVHSSSRYRYDEEGGDCPSIQLAGSNLAGVSYTAFPDGSMGLDVDVAVAAGCGAHATGDVECVDAGTSVAPSGAYYLTLTEPQNTYRLHGSFNCTGMNGNVTFISPLQATVLRFEDGVAWEPTEAHPTGVEAADGLTPISPVLASSSCDSDQSQVFDLTFRLDRYTESAEEEVVIMLFGAVQFFPLFTMPPAPPIVPAPGDFVSEGTMEWNLKLESVN